jgi:nucleotide-binding universal stress UspA family protein
MYKHVLIATDGSSLSGRAVDQGVGLAKSLGADVSLLTVSEPFHLFAVDVGQVEETPSSFREHRREQALKTLSQAAEVARSVGVEATQIHLEDDDPYRAIVRTAEGRRCDLIVMASHGRSGVSALLLGSETMKVLTHSKIPVLVVR